MQVRASADAPVVFIGGHGAQGVRTFREASLSLRGFRFAASSGAAFALGIWLACGSRGLRALLRSRHRLLLSGWGSPRERLTLTQRLLEQLGLSLEAPVPEGATLMAFDCERLRPVVLDRGSLAEALVACTSHVPVETGCARALDVELVLHARILADHVGAFACILPERRQLRLLEGGSGATFGKVLGMLESVLARYQAPRRCIPGAFHLSVPGEVRRLASPEAAPGWSLRLASTLLVASVWLLTRRSSASVRRP